MTQNDERDELKEVFSRYLSGSEKFNDDTAVFHDLIMTGDDVYELLEDIAKKFNVSFEGFEFKQYFPYEGEDFLLSPFSMFGVRKFWGKQYQPVTIGHLRKVIENGKWFDPPQQNK